MKTKYRWYVEVMGHRMLVDAPSKTNAARQAFKALIKLGHLKNPPRTTRDGGWENTFVLCKGEVGKVVPQPKADGISGLDKLVEGA